MSLLIVSGLVAIRPSEAAPISDKDAVLKSISLVDLPGGAVFIGVKEGERHEQQGYPGLIVHLKPFRIAKTDVTFEQYDAFAQASGHLAPQDEGFGRETRPVINVNRQEMLDFIRWLNTGTGRHFRLLSEAEWEYAARGGTTTPYYWGDNPSSDYANLSENTGRDHFVTTAPVASFLPNPFGLYDMAGTSGKKSKIVPILALSVFRKMAEHGLVDGVTVTSPEAAGTIARHAARALRREPPSQKAFVRWGLVFDWPRIAVIDRPPAQHVISLRHSERYCH